MTDTAANDPTTNPLVDQNQADATAQAGPDATLVECPTCHNQRRAFTIVDGKCDSCRSQGQPASIVQTLGWPEVRQRRGMLIQKLDWTQLSDVSDDVKTKYAGTRQSLRDITAKSTPLEAWYALDGIEADLAK